MPADTTYALFGNTLVSKGFDFTFAPGVQPSVCMITTVPHVATLPQVGDLSIYSQGELFLSLRDCLVEDPKLSASIAGNYVQLPVKDRRWKWQFGAVYGWYNKPEANGTLTRPKTPRELASILLESMGERTYDVSKLPNDVKPEKKWDGASPAAELDALCEALGCVVVLNPLSDIVELWPVGQGSPLPIGGTSGRISSPVLPAKPSTIEIWTNPILFQATWQTEAVGMDTDGTWKPLNQLSYATTGRFSGSAALSGFRGYWENQTYVYQGKTLHIRDLAASTVFKHYRLRTVAGWKSGIVPPYAEGKREPFSLKDFQFFDTLATKSVDSASGALLPDSATVFASYQNLDKWRRTSPELYEKGFSFDPDSLIIGFSEPLFLWSTTVMDQATPATVLFETSFYCGENGIFNRYVKSSGTNAPSLTPPLAIQHQEIKPHIIYYADNTGAANTTSDNLADTEQKATYWLTAELGKYELLQGGTINYVGLIGLAPDGLTQQITWSGGDGRRAATTVSQAQRHNRYIKPPAEQRVLLTQRRQELLIAQMEGVQVA